jgi:pimeloyl-ACP methyl ester carboxylesterase
MATPATFMLVHGACHGAWCWDRVVPLLEASGHRVVTPDLPGRGDKGRPGWRWSLPAYVQALVEAARLADAPVVAVGHSMGGLVMSAAAEAAPRLFARLVYVSAFLPVDGDSLVSIAAMDAHSDLKGASSVAWFKGVVTINPDKLQPVYYSDCSEADIDWVRPRLVPESLGPSVTRVRLGDRFQSVPRSYIRCTQDRALSIQMQDRLIERQPCQHVATLEASHSPFLSMPKAFAHALRSVAPSETQAPLATPQH